MASALEHAATGHDEGSCSRPASGARNRGLIIRLHRHLLAPPAGHELFASDCEPVAALTRVHLPLATFFASLRDVSRKMSLVEIKN